MCLSKELSFRSRKAGEESAFCLRVEAAVDDQNPNPLSSRPKRRPALSTTKLPSAEWRDPEDVCSRNKASRRSHQDTARKNPLFAFQLLTMC